MYTPIHTIISKFAYANNDSSRNIKQMFFSYLYGS